MAFLNSRQIAAYPVVNRNEAVSGDIYARHTSEELMSGIVNKLISVDGFVITLPEKLAFDAPFMFNIHGYYFKILKFKDLLDSFKPDGLKTGEVIWGSISIEKNGTWWELYGGDITNDLTPTEESVYYYNGVSFVHSLQDLPTHDNVEEGEYTTFRQPLIKYVGPTLPADWPDVQLDLRNFIIEEDYAVRYRTPAFIVDVVDGGIV